MHGEHMSGVIWRKPRARGFRPPASAAREAESAAAQAQLAIEDGAAAEDDPASEDDLAAEAPDECDDDLDVLGPDPQDGSSILKIHPLPAVLGRNGLYLRSHFPGRGGAGYP